MTTNTEENELDDKDSVMPPIFHPEQSDNKEDLIDPFYAEPTPEPVPPSKKTTKETTSEPDSDSLSEPSVLTREGSMEHLTPKEIARNKKGSYQPIFTTLDERTKEYLWGDARKTHILGQYEGLESGEYLLTPNKRI